jgi:hypothetical protein
VRWLPIRGLSPTQVRERLGEATIYLDLGPHPGKDRMPREAALAGAVTVVARRGSGDNDQDVSLPDHHKVSLGGHLAERAVAAACAVLDDPVTAYAEQHGYRAGIQGEEEVFRRQVAGLVARLREPAPSGGDS